MYLRLSEQIPGWTRGEEAIALAQRTFLLPDAAVVVEVGSFFGSGTVLLAGARKLRRSGKVHCVDPFDGSGDAVSEPQYLAIITAFAGRTPREHFDENLRKSGLEEWVEAHQGTAEEIVTGWTTPIDLLFIDGDQSPAGARAAYVGWAPWLKVGGLLALHNSNRQERAPGHDGYFLVAQEFVRPPAYVDVEVIGSITFARKAL